MPDLHVGVELLQYADQITAIVQSLSDASDAARQAANLLNGDSGYYDGRARAEMKQFCDSYADNIDKLVFFESAAQQFLGRAFAEFDFNDQDLATIITAWMESR